MAIDDPIDAAEALIHSDQRQETTVLEVVASLGGAFLDPRSKLLEFFGSVASRRSEENRNLLLDVLKEEVQKMKGQLETLSEDHRRFVEEEFPGLVCDGLQKSQDVRAKERVKRIARILAGALKEGPEVAADETEEMMRVATSLGENDVMVLLEIYIAQVEDLKRASGRLNVDNVNQAWRDSLTCRLSSDHRLLENSASRHG